MDVADIYNLLCRPLRLGISRATNHLDYQRLSIWTITSWPTICSTAPQCVGDDNVRTKNRAKNAPFKDDKGVTMQLKLGLSVAAIAFALIAGTSGATIISVAVGGPGSA